MTEDATSAAMTTEKAIDDKELKLHICREWLSDEVVMYCGEGALLFADGSTEPYIDFYHKKGGQHATCEPCLRAWQLDEPGIHAE